MEERDIATPWQTERVLGQEHAKQQFYQAVKSGRLGHGWLFTGPHGVGKMSLALQIARSVLNDIPPVSDHDLDAGFKSEAGHLVSRGVHPDLRVVALGAEEDAKKSIDVEQIRALKSFFTKSAGRSIWRVAIIDAIDDMTRQAVNALLKLLEEPPPSCLVIIINHNAGRVIETVRSRCQKLVFAAPKPELTAEIVGALLPHTDAQTRAASAYLAQGSIGRTIAMIEAGGLALFETIMSLLASKRAEDISELHRFCDAMNRRDQGDQFSLFVSLLSDWVYRLARHQADGAGFHPVFEHENSLATVIVGQASADDLYACWERLGEIGRQTETFNLEKKQASFLCFQAVRDLMPAPKAM